MEGLCHSAMGPIISFMEIQRKRSKIWLFQNRKEINKQGNSLRPLEMLIIGLGVTLCMEKLGLLYRMA